MSVRSKVSAATSDEIEAIQDLISDLEKRLGRLNKSAKKEVIGGANDVSDFVSEALASITSRVRDGAGSVTDKVVDEATRIGADTLKRITDEVDQRPLAMLAVAAGIGFLFGLSRR
jgi:ElaB/YqjD/DUF883 family membrane-anchored ribosome-binding protein